MIPKCVGKVSKDNNQHVVQEVQNTIMLLLHLLLPIPYCNEHEKKNRNFTLINGPHFELFFRFFDKIFWLFHIFIHMAEIDDFESDMTFMLTDTDVF